MRKELLSRYEVLVFSTGEIEVHPIIDEGDLKDCSSSMRQILTIIEFVLQYKKDYPQRNIHYAVVSAVNHVSAMERVTPPTVHAKINRKLGLSMQDFKKQLQDCIDKKAPANDVLVQELYNACVSRTKQADEAGVKRVVKKIKIF